MDEQERADLVKQYRDGYRVVTVALAGVTDEELDRSATGDWTPRQIAHHLADSEMMSAIRIRLLLAEPQPVIYGYDEKAFAERLTADRPIQPSLEAMRWARDQDCRRNARWLRERFSAMGMDAQIVDVLQNKLPVVVADSPHLSGKPHVTIYGHYDVQPPDPLEQWTSPPFEPAIRDGHVWARGAADNKGNHMATVKAVEHLVAAGGPPVNIRFLLEG